MDGPYSKELQRLLAEAFAAKKVVAAVGRGVAALLSAKITDPQHPQSGLPIVYGKQVPYHTALSYPPTSTHHEISTDSLSRPVEPSSV